MKLSKLAVAGLSAAIVSALLAPHSFADTKAQQQKNDAAQAQAKSDAQAAQGHTLRAARQAKKAEDATQQANQASAKSAACVRKSRKHK